MKPSIYSAVDKNDLTFQGYLLCAALSLLLLTTNSAYSQPIDSEPDSALAPSISLQTQSLDMPSNRPEHQKADPALIDELVQLADAQSLIGKYGNAVRSLEIALRLSRTHNGLYHYSQVEIIDALIANEVLRKNWEAVNDLYDLEEHLLRRLFEPTDARLETGLEKITAWHVRAVNEDIDSNKKEHFEKVQKLLATRLTVVENLLGDDNARYDFLRNNLAYVEFELVKLRLKRYVATGPLGHQFTPTKIE